MKPGLHNIPLHSQPERGIQKWLPLLYKSHHEISISEEDGPEHMHLVVRGSPPTATFPSVVYVRTEWEEIGSSHKQEPATLQGLRPESVTSPPLEPAPRTSQGPQ